jgi:hypothetical protein
VFPVLFCTLEGPHPEPLNVIKVVLVPELISDATAAHRVGEAQDRLDTPRPSAKALDHDEPLKVVSEFPSLAAQNEMLGHESCVAVTGTGDANCIHEVPANSHSAVPAVA